MEKERVVDYQKKFSNLHSIITLCITVLVIEYGIFENTGQITYYLFLCFLAIAIEIFVSHHLFFHNIRFIMAYRYIQVLFTSILLVMDLNQHMEGITYVMYLLTAVEFITIFDVSDKYYQYFTLSLIFVPEIFLQIIRAITYSKDIVILSSMISVVIVFLFLLAIVRFYIEVTNCLEGKYLAQLRYIEDANAVNQQLVENQAKVKKANEQLAYQKVQLEFANRKINNVNTEILLQNQILQLISAHHEVDRLMALIAATIRAQMNVDTFAIILYENVNTGMPRIFQVRTSYGMKYQQYLAERVLTGDFCSIIEKKQTFVDNHVSADTYPFVKNTEVSSLMIIPLIKGEDVIGGLYIADSKYDAFIDNVAFFEATVSSINIAVENANLYARLEEMAIKDELTKIYNRRYLNQVCERYIYEALKDKTPLSCAMFDIDKFKMFNDTYGHLFGDETLKVVAGMANELAEEANGIAGRYGGEEFVVLFPNRNLEATYEMVKEYQQKVRTVQLYHGDELVQVRVSIGISSFPQTCMNPSELLSHADWAMYYSKETGRDRITIDSTEIRELVKLK